MNQINLFFLGHGKTKSCSSCEKEGRGTFLNKAINQIIGDNASVIIVSPSFSGSYSLPFLEKYQGIVSIAATYQRILTIGGWLIEPWLILNKTRSKQVTE